MTDTPIEFDTSNEYDQASEMVAVKKTCVAYFFGGPLDGARAARFLWAPEYRTGNAFFAWPVWEIQDRDDPESVCLLGSYKYDITVMKDDDAERIINCTNAGFSSEGC